jgi:hypothetical protein
MNPETNIAPPDDNNSLLRRILWAFRDENGNAQPGSPGGPIPGDHMLSTTKAAAGPLPVIAVQLVPSRLKRTSAYIRNLDSTNTIWFLDTPSVTDATGFTLKPNESAPCSFKGAIYIYCVAGAPIAQFNEVYAD